MPDTIQLARLTPYIKRLLEDENVQADIGNALASLRQGARRARNRPATEALRDQKLHNQITSAFRALTSAQRKLAEPPPQHSGARRLLVIAAAGLAAAQGHPLASERCRRIGRTAQLPQKPARLNQAGCPSRAAGQ